MNTWISNLTIFLSELFRYLEKKGKFASSRNSSPILNFYFMPMQLKFDPLNTCRGK